MPQEAQPPYILALDVGTSSVRALLFDGRGAVVPEAHVQHTYDLTISNDGEVSVDAGTLVEVVAGTIDEALKAAEAAGARSCRTSCDDTRFFGLVHLLYRAIGKFKE